MKPFWSPLCNITLFGGWVGQANNKQPECEFHTSHNTASCPVQSPMKHFNLGVPQKYSF